MSLRSHLNNPTTRMQIGLIALIVASVTNFLVHRAHQIPADWVDVVIGFLYGTAIAMLLGSLRSWRAKSRAPHGRG
jgi:hypothetical protein